MSTVAFEEIAQVFDCAHIWVSGYEEYWFRRAWAALEKQELTEANSDFEFYMVVFRALSLSLIYLKFCSSAFGEYNEYYLQDCIEGLVPDYVIGLVTGQLLTKDDHAEDYADSINDALILIAEDGVYDVLKHLKMELSVEDIFLGMYCTGFTPCRYVEIEPDEDDEDCAPLYEEEPYEISNYEEYWAMIAAEAGNILNTPDCNALAGYEWLL